MKRFRLVHNIDRTAAAAAIITITKMKTENAVIRDAWQLKIDSISHEKQAALSILS